MSERGESGRILHVDDDGDFAALTAEYLERTSDRITVETETNASAALDRLDDERFDCLVSDYDMHEMDGLSLLDAVRESHPDLPFILFTGVGNDAIASDAISRGATDFLRKRSGTEVYELLANRIEQAIERRRIERRATRLDHLQRLGRAVERVLARAETRAEIERELCEAVGDIDTHRFAWIGTYDTDTAALEPRASVGIETEQLDPVDIADDERVPDRPAAKAIWTRDVATADGVVAVPLLKSDRLYGVLSVGVTAGVGGRKRTLLSELGDDIAHAMSRVESSRDRYEHLVDALPVGTYRASADGDIVDTDETFAEMFGADSADAMRDHALDELHLDDDDRADLHRRLAADDLVRNVELRQQTLDGTPIWVSVTAVRTETEDGTYVDGVVRDVTDQKERERQRQQFQSAVEHAGHVVLITDSDGVIEYVNGAFEEVTGYDASEAIGRPPSILQSGQHGGEFYRDLWETISSGEVWQGEVINERKDGQQYIIDQTVAPITDDGDIDGFVAINRNITDRKERELNLAFLKQAIDQAGIGIGTYGADGYATYVNARLADLFGTERDELREYCLTDLDPNLDSGRFGEYWDSFDDGERRIYDTHIERIDTAEAVPAEVITSRVELNGDPYQVNTVRDATDRKRRTKDLERFRSAVEHAGHSVLITDTDGTIEYVNDAFESMSGYSAAEAIGETPALLRSGEHDSEFYRDLWETILDGEVWQGEVVNERKDGTRYVIDQTIAPITADGELSGFVSINRDVTALREYEQELEAQNERLRQYGQTVAHDLRNPLALLDAELTQFEAAIDDEAETVDAESIRGLCTDIGSTVTRMEILIDDLLTMAEHGQRVLEFEATSLETVSAEAWEQVDGASATLSVDDADIDADPARLRELLTNLFRNSVEHAGADTHIRVEPLDFSDGFAVEDDGPGIPADSRDDVFDHGFTTAENGTGFGLAIVEQIAEAHDWNVSVSEGRDGGARFEFRVDRGR